MTNSKYLYNITFQDYEEELCNFEVRSLFNINLNSKVFFSNKELSPSISPFIRNRLEVIYKTSTFVEIVKLIIKDELVSHEFKVKYLQLHKDDPNIENSNNLCKELGLVIHGFPSFKSPKTVFGVTYYEGSWYFGILETNNSLWKAHKKKPFSYSSSLGINIAKVLVNCGGNGDTNIKMVDPCCGVGTVLLEAIFAGYSIVGCEINEKVADNARRNLQHFNYFAKVINDDIQNINDSFDVSIVDLPYGNFSNTDLDKTIMIIRNAKRISKKIVLVSSYDITKEILAENLRIIDYCKVNKSKKSSFARRIWVCA